jgi:hypothetical protein
MTFKIINNLFLKKFIILEGNIHITSKKNIK